MFNEGSHPLLRFYQVEFGKEYNQYVENYGHPTVDAIRARLGLEPEGSLAVCWVTRVLSALNRRYALI